MATHSLTKVGRRYTLGDITVATSYINPIVPPAKFVNVKYTGTPYSASLGAYTLMIWSGSGTIQFSGSANLDYAVVAGGGGGYCGGGGGGGVRSAYGYFLTGSSNYTLVTVGGGGAGVIPLTIPYANPAFPGTASAFLFITASGGGGGSDRCDLGNGGNGGCGGGMGYTNNNQGKVAGTGIAGQGYDGGTTAASPNDGASSGGGGAGGIGGNGATGAPGGGGAPWTGSNGFTGYYFGKGGDGIANNGGAGAAGGANTGKGGGAAGGSNLGGNGGSGVVMFYFLTPDGGVLKTG